MAEHGQGQSYNRGKTDDHEDVDPHVDKEEKGKSPGKGFDVVVAFVLPRDVKQVENKQDVEANDGDHPFEAQTLSEVGEDEVGRGDRQELQLCLRGILFGFALHTAASNGNECLAHLIAWFVEHVVNTLLLIGFKPLFVDNRCAYSCDDGDGHPYLPVDTDEKENAVAGNEQHQCGTKVRLLGDDKEGDDNNE